MPSIREYLKAMSERSAVRKVNEDRKANTEVMLAARAAKKPG
jgi:glutathione S-transferase